MALLDSLQRADTRLFAWFFQSGERPLLATPARAVSASGDGILHVLTPLLLISAGVGRAWELLWLMGLALCLERPAYWLLKNSLRRRRPQAFNPGWRSLIIASDQFSFPSGHSSGAFLLATSLYLVYSGSCAVAFAWATAVALSRVILGVHFPGDLLAGAAMGTGLALLAGNILGVI